MSLQYISTEDLEKELERRKTIPPKPQPLSYYNFDELKLACIQYIEEINEGDFVDSSSDHYIFERALEAIYGKDVWKWVCAKLT